VRARAGERMSTTEMAPGADEGGEANNGHDGDGTPPLAAAAEGGATLDISESSEGEAASDESDEDDETRVIRREH
jgi:hypothetical protein